MPRLSSVLWDRGQGAYKNTFSEPPSVRVLKMTADAPSHLHVCMDMAAAEDGTRDVTAYRGGSQCLTPQTHRVETQYSRTARLAHVSNILTGADPQ